MTFKLAHISDIHFGPLPKASLQQLLSKRMTGYINWHRNRRHSRDTSILGHLTAQLRDLAPDHIAVTGDLVNIGLPEEIENTGLWLAQLGRPEDVSVVPGNHDAYVRGVLAKALMRWQPYVLGDDKSPVLANADFPYLRRRGPIALIGVNSAVATAPFVAAGRVDKQQLERLRGMLDQTGREGCFRVIAIHHPPVHGAARPQKRLYGISAFGEVIASAGAELVLHGHTHLPQRHILAGKDGKTVPVIGVPSASEGPGAKRPPSGYNLLTIDQGKHSRWTCRLEAYSYGGPALPYHLAETRLYDV